MSEGSTSTVAPTVSTSSSDATTADSVSDVELDGNSDSSLIGQSNDGKEKSEKPVLTQEEDPEFDLDGEKYKKSQLKEIAKRRKEFDAAAHRKFQEAAENRKAIEAKEAEIIALASAIQKNPWALHEKLGLNPDQIAEQRILDQMKRAQMSPEQIAFNENMRKQEMELEELRRFKEATEKTQKQQAHDQLVSQYKEHFDKQIATAIDKANLPRTLRSAQQVAKVMADYMDMGEQIDPVIAAQIVRNGYGKEISHEASELAKSNPQALIEMLGPDVIAAIMKNQVQKSQQFEPQKKKVQQLPHTPKPQEPPDFEQVRKSLAAQGF